jgi:hypothetical protein
MKERLRRAFLLLLDVPALVAEWLAGWVNKVLGDDN